MAAGFDIYTRREGGYQLIVPICHEDGDMVDIYLQNSPRGEAYIRICDFGMALMRLSYSYELNSDTRRRIFDDILIHNQVANDDGSLCLDVPVGALYEGKFSSPDASKKCATCATGQGKSCAVPSTKTSATM